MSTFHQETDLPQPFSQEGKTMEKAVQELEVLLELKSYFFPLNRAEKSRLVEGHISRIVDLLSQDERSTPCLDARRCFLRGRAYDCREEYCEEAEDELARAVKVVEDTTFHFSFLLLRCDLD